MSSRPANTRLYASTIHCNELDSACRSRASVGSATFRLAFAITIITRLMQSTPRVHHLRSYSRALGPSGRDQVSFDGVMCERVDVDLDCVPR